MLDTSAAEFAATGALVIFWFQGLSAGNRLLPRSVGTVRSSRASSWSGRRALVRRDGVCWVRRILANHDVEFMMVLPSATALLPIPPGRVRGRGADHSRQTSLESEKVSDVKP